MFFFWLNCSQLCIVTAVLYSYRLVISGWRPPGLFQIYLSTCRFRFRKDSSDKSQFKYHKEFQPQFRLSNWVWASFPAPHIWFFLSIHFILPLPLHTFRSSSLHISFFLLLLFHSSSPHISFFFFLSTHFILPLHTVHSSSPLPLLPPAFFCHLSFTQKSETISFTQSFVCFLHSSVPEFHSPFFLPFFPSIRLSFLHSGIFSLSLSLFSSCCLQHWPVSPPLVQRKGSLIRSTNNAVMVNDQGLPRQNHTRKHTPLASIKSPCKN